MRSALNIVELPEASKGFTLVELLVVITIIVVLLSLLSPALDQAVYQAELAACGAKLKAFGSGLTSGATAYRRAYPTRQVLGLPISVSMPAGAGTSAALDDRPILREYLGVSLNKALNDPLTKAVDIDGSKPNSSVQGSYAMWFSWNTGENERSMRKLGDRWTWSAGRDGAKGTADDVEYSFDLLAQDYHQRYSVTPYNLTSHPDHDQVLWQIAYKDAGGANANGITILGSETTSGWLLSGADEFGALDYNLAFADGAVIRYAKVTGHDTDERMTRVPITRAPPGAESATVDWYRVPKP